MDGRPYMNAAGYHHGLPGEQGNPLEAFLAHGTGICANWLLPICYIHTVRENNIAGNTVKISMRIIREFRCAEGRIGIVQHGRFELLADGHIAKDEDVYAQRRREPSPPQQNPESSLLLSGVPVK